MAHFIPNKQHFREVLLFCFHLKMKAVASHRLLVEAYGDQAVSESTCREWYRRFKDGDFDVNDKERLGQPKKFEDTELLALLDEDPSQMLKYLSETLNFDYATVSKRLKTIGMIRNRLGYWIPGALTERHIERRLLTCEMLLQRYRRQNSFLHRIVTGDEKWIFFDNPKRSKTSESTSTSQPKSLKAMLCIWWDENGVVYYELLQPGQTITDELYGEQLLKLSRALRENRPAFTERQDKVVFQHDNARPHVAESVKSILESTNWDILPHQPHSPDLYPTNYHLFKSMPLAGQHFKSYEDILNWLSQWIASQSVQFFYDGIHSLPEQWEKVIANGGQYFE